MSIDNISTWVSEVGYLQGGIECFSRSEQDASGGDRGGALGNALESTLGGGLRGGFGVEVNPLSIACPSFRKRTSRLPPHQHCMMLKSMILRLWPTLFKRSDSKMVLFQVVGTNGKGGFCRQLSTLLRSAHFDTVEMSSPHILSLRERLLINGEMLALESLNQWRDTYRRYFPGTIDQFLALLCESLHSMLCRLPSDGEGVAGIIETGIGGRFDSAKILDAEVVVITSIGQDHQALLGYSRQERMARKVMAISPKTQLAILPQELHFDPFTQQWLNFCKTPAYYARDSAEAIHLCLQLARNRARGRGIQGHAHRSKESSLMNQSPIDTTSSVARHPQFQTLQASAVTKSIDRRKLPVEALRGRQQWVATPWGICLVDVAHNADALSYLCEQLRRDQCSLKGGTDRDVHEHNPWRIDDASHERPKKHSRHCFKGHSRISEGVPFNSEGVLRCELLLGLTPDRRVQIDWGVLQRCFEQLYYYDFTSHKLERKKRDCPEPRHDCRDDACWIEFFRPKFDVISYEALSRPQRSQASTSAADALIDGVKSTCLKERGAGSRDEVAVKSSLPDIFTDMPFERFDDGFAMQVIARFILGCHQRGVLPCIAGSFHLISSFYKLERIWKRCGYER